MIIFKEQQICKYSRQRKVLYGTMCGVV